MFSISKVKMGVLTLVAAPILLSIQGCDEGQAIATVGTLAVVGGAVAVANDNYYRDGYYNDGYYRGRYYRGGYYRNGYYNGGYYNNNPGYNRGYRGWNRINAEVVDAVPTAEEQKTIELNNTALMAARYGLPMAAANTLKDTLRTSYETQSLQPIYELGLSQADIYSFGQGQEVSNAGLHNVATKLGITPDQARTVLAKMKSDAQSGQTQMASAE